MQKTAGVERSNAMEKELAGVKGERDARVKENDEARQKCELTLLQLHQVQEELERYFLETRVQADLLRQQQTQSLAMRQAISKLVVDRG